ncbi:MAG: hypothetical protein IJA14_01280, partial [Alphaproteobacteria bacterium]|nr:hypothetical protein [Alphaproteobacteria bacterium]
MKKVFAIGFLATAICDASLGMKNPMLHLSNDSVNADHALVTGSFNNPENVGKLNSLFAGMNSKEIDELYKSARSEAFEVIASIFLGKANDVVQHVLDRTPLSQAGMLFWTFLNNGQDTLKFIGDIAGIEAPLAIQDWCKPLLNKYEDPRLPLEQ